MKLLFDENLSPRLVQALEEVQSVFLLILGESRLLIWLVGCEQAVDDTSRLVGGGSDGFG